jgi:ketosteroid isomerase-like protein
MGNVTLEVFSAWCNSFCRAWEQQDTDAILSIFTDHAVFRESPFEPPEVGRENMRRAWDELSEMQRDNRMDCEVLATWNSSGIARWKASYTRAKDGVFRELDGIILCHFSTDGRCTELLEWRHARDNGVPVPLGVRRNSETGELEHV